MKFFQELLEYTDGVDIHLIIHKNDQNELTVSVLPKVMRKEAAKTVVPPLDLKGTAEELDTTFFERLRVPLYKTKGLAVEIKRYEEALAKGVKDMKQLTAGKSAKEKAGNTPVARETKTDKVVQPAIEQPKQPVEKNGQGNLF